MARFSEDLNISMTEIHRLLEHWGLKDWREYLVVRVPDKPESFIVLAHPSDKSDFADQLVQLHKDDAIGIVASEEVGRWQEAIRELVIKLSGATHDDIDGSGCDSGDPLDLTLTEISQAFGHIEERIRADVKAACPSIPSTPTGSFHAERKRSSLEITMLDDASVEVEIYANEDKATTYLESDDLMRLRNWLDGKQPAKDFKALLARYKFTDELGHSLENCVEYVELLKAAGTTS